MSKRLRVLSRRYYGKLFLNTAMTGDALKVGTWAVVTVSRMIMKGESIATWKIYAAHRRSRYRKAGSSCQRSYLIESQRSVPCNGLVEAMSSHNGRLFHRRITAVNSGDHRSRTGLLAWLFNVQHVEARLKLSKAQDYSQPLSYVIPCVIV